MLMWDIRNLSCATPRLHTFDIFIQIKVKLIDKLFNGLSAICLLHITSTNVIQIIYSNVNVQDLI